MDKLGALNLPVTLHTLAVILNRVVEEVCIGKQPELVNRAVDEAQPVPQREMLFGYRQGFSGKLYTHTIMCMYVGILYVYLYIYIYVYACMHAWMYVLFIYEYIHIYICIYAHVYVFI